MKKLMIHIYSLIKEFLLFFGCYFLLLFPIEWSWKKVKKKPILLVHGYLNNSNVFLFLGNFLNKKELGPIYTVNFGWPFFSIEEYAKKLEKKILEIKEETKMDEIILVGHSMGALVSLYFSLNMKNGVNVSKIICIGAPFEGTKRARLGFGRCAKQMRYRSNFLKSLKEKILKEDKIKIYFVATLLDQIVVPSNSAILKDIKNSFIVNNLGHSSLLFSKKVASKIYLWIKNSTL